MILTILGASSAAPNPGGACSSYLLRYGATTLVIDAGSGSFANLQRHVSPADVDAVVISHMHADHMLDLIQYRYWLDFRGVDAERRPRLLLPPDGHIKALRLSALQDDSPEFYSSCFRVEEYDPAGMCTVGDLSIRFVAVNHAPHTYGLRVQGNGVLGFSADSGPTDALLEVVRDTDLFLCENANSGAAGDSPLHLLPRQAAGYARDGGARRLVLTHRWHESGLDAALREALEQFDGPVSLAREGDSYAIYRHAQRT